LKKRNPISILEDSFHSIKEYIESEFTSSKTFFDTTFIQKLKIETLAVSKLCTELNANSEFIQKINDKVLPTQANGLLLKTEHFFLSDSITLYNSNLNLENEKALISFAYYYDVLRNNYFTDENAITTLNKIAANSEFQNNLKKHRVQHKLISKNANQKSFVLQTLSEMNHPKLDEMTTHFKNFMQLTFDVSNNEAEIKEQISMPISKQSENSQVSFPPENDTLEKVLAELNEMVGLEKVKTDINELVNLLEIQKKRTKEGLKNVDIALHTVFLGPPGTGKTSVARLLSRIFKHLGFLSKGQMYETDREGMVAGYVGQTATKVDAVVTESIGGVLFVDEAYALTQTTLGNDYGAEAVNTMLKRMEDHRNDLAVVVAGYTEPMKMFVESNPGLRSRFNRYFHFEHFKPEELFQIFETFCKKSDFVITDEAKEKLKDTFELLYAKKDEGFGNARVIRNIFEKCVQNQANRIVVLKEINATVLKTLTEQDIPEPKETEKGTFFSTE
jgi:stage V sporulation protein K